MKSGFPRVQIFVKIDKFCERIMERSEPGVKNLRMANAGTESSSRGLAIFRAAV